MSFFPSESYRSGCGQGLNPQVRLGGWALKLTKSKTGYDFIAFGGGELSPEVSWIEKSRLVEVEIVGLIPVVPDFVIELRSATDNLKSFQEKMVEYPRLGVRLGLLVNPKNRQVEISRPEQEVVVLESPDAIDCNQVMPGFMLSMSRIW